MEQLLIEYHHKEFLKHVGNKLGKLLKIDAVTSSAIRGRFARLCVQLDTINPLPKCLKIGTFWQDIVYENILVLCYRYGRLGHKEANCSEATEVRKDTLVSLVNTRGDGGMAESENSHTPWKTVQTRRP